MRSAHSLRSPRFNQRPSPHPSDARLAMAAGKTFREKLIDAQNFLSAAEGDFDATMCKCRANPTVRNLANVKRARNRIDEAARCIALLDQSSDR